MKGQVLVKEYGLPQLFGWGQDVDSIRQKYGISPFRSSFPPDLLEQLAAA